MRIEPNDDQQIVWVFSGSYAVASFAYEAWGGRDRAVAAADGFTKRDKSLEALHPFADAARHHAAYAPEWNEHDTVQAVLRIGDLRAALDAVEQNDTGT